MAEMGQSMQLDFNQAMQDFRIMFPDMDADVIEAVLRANRGAVHATIDQLLTMATDVENHKSCLLPSDGLLEASVDPSHNIEGATNYELPPAYALSATPPPSYHQAVPSPHRSPGIRNTDYSDGKQPLRFARNWNPPILLPLPKDFLRIIPPPHHGVSVLSPQRLSERLSENALAREAVGESDMELAQYLKDERIALFLQNDEFISELRSNKEFMNALQKDHDGDADDEDEYDFEESSHSFRGSKRLNSKKSDSGGTGGIIATPLDDAKFRERLANMGKVSRKKFAHLAKVFTRAKRPSGPRTLLPSGVGGTSDTNGKDLLMSSEALIDDYDDDKNSQINEEILTTPIRKHP